MLPSGPVPWLQPQKSSETVLSQGAGKWAVERPSGAAWMAMDLKMSMNWSISFWHFVHL